MTNTPESVRSAKYAKRAKVTVFFKPPEVKPPPEVHPEPKAKRFPRSPAEALGLPRGWGWE